MALATAVSPPLLSLSLSLSLFLALSVLSQFYLCLSLHCEGSLVQVSREVCVWSMNVDLYFPELGRLQRFICCSWAFSLSGRIKRSRRQR